MDFMRRLSWLLLIFTLFLLLFALIGGKEEGQPKSELTRHRREGPALKSHVSKRQGVVLGEQDAAALDDDGDDMEWDVEQKHHISIQTTNVDEEERKEREKDREVKQALMQMMKLTENKVANRHQKRFDNVPGLDFRREFASDEANPYI
ncbi:uncharacterized protein [Drosophila virilis]|uniref:Uncharacterized protein n=1 Tax=Drosophila virilis TaxID=7244 RepID=B4MAF4_DROVI|nr:uncharacterized protein LOC6634620 [Drosophila virilis]EDW66213.1 uncharacterized protein Dvir_GJ15901 [Drosophila virilis]